MRGIPDDRYPDRLTRARHEASAAGLDALLVGVGADLCYLAGYDALPLERLTLLVVPTAEGSPVTLIAPRLEASPARGCAAAVVGALDVTTWEETQDPMRLVADCLDRAAGRPPGSLSVAVSDGLRAAFVLGLQRVLPGARFSLTSTVLRGLRMRKDLDEVALLRLAAQAADRVIAAVSGGRLIGRTEADVAREVRDRLVAEGHDQSEFWIVASGPNSASPHHDPGDRVIGAGEPIVIDIGGSLGGYGSDITRTIWVTGPAEIGPDNGFRALYPRCSRMRRLRPLPSCGRASPARRSTRRPDAGSPTRATGRSSSIELATASGWRATRTPTWWPETASGSPRGWRSALSPASTSRGGTGPGSRTSSCAVTTDRSCSTSSPATCSSCGAERGEDRGPGVSSADRPSPRPTPEPLFMTYPPERVNDPRFHGR